MLKVSPSAISYLLECPKCLWLFFNEEVKRPRGIFPSLPSGMDEIFKVYFDQYRKKGELPPEIDGKIEGRLFDDMAKLDIWRNIDFGRGGLRAEFPEYDILLAGAIDELIVAPDGQFIIFDFKTRGYPVKEDTAEHYQSQLDLYALLFKKGGFKPAPFGYLLFFWPGSYSEGIARFNTELVKMDVSSNRGQGVLKQVREIIDSPKPNSHEQCEYCHYRKFDL